MPTHAGRPTRYSAKMRRRLIAAARKTMTITGAAASCGIPIGTLRHWFYRHEGLKAEMEQAIEDGWDDCGKEAIHSIFVHFQRHADDPKIRLDSRIVEGVLRRTDPRWRDAYQSREAVADSTTGDREKIAALDEAMKRDV